MTAFQLIGMVHVLPLPGSPSYRLPVGEVVSLAVRDATLLEEAGFDAVMVENFGDAPFYADDVPPVTVAGLSRVVAAVRDQIDIPVGVNVLRNDAIAGLAIATACEASFIRVNVLSGTMFTDQGPIAGRAAEVSRMRAALDPNVEVLADLWVKHAVPPAGLEPEDAASDLWERGGADGIIVSGRATGQPTDRTWLHRIREAVPQARLLVGSGVDPTSVAHLIGACDGAIVGTALKRDGQVRHPVDPVRARALVKAAREGC